MIATATVTLLSWFLNAIIADAIAVLDNIEFLVMPAASQHECTFRENQGIGYYAAVVHPGSKEQADNNLMDNLVGSQQVIPIIFQLYK